jgi:uncharacterized membrane protein
MAANVGSRVLPPAKAVHAMLGLGLLGFALSLSVGGSAAAVESMGETPPREAIKPLLELIATCIEVSGVAIIVIGAVAATIYFVFGGLFGVGWPGAFHLYRANLGRGILLGLELLVAADIIGTVAVTPSINNLIILGLIVLIRTFLSFSLEVEIEGRWPWRRAEQERGSQPPASDARL